MHSIIAIAAPTLPAPVECYVPDIQNAMVICTHDLSLSRTIPAAESCLVLCATGYTQSDPIFWRDQCIAGVNELGLTLTECIPAGWWKYSARK